MQIAVFQKDIKKEKLMYQFKEIDFKEINEFNKKDLKGHIFQTSYWADVKKEWKAKYLGGYTEDGQLVLTSMLLLRDIPYVNKNMGYIPRGFICDYTNKVLVKEFTAFLKEYGKKNKIAFITVDPDIHLKEDELLLEKGQNISDLLLEAGYINKKAKNFENIQPNFVFRLDIDLPGTIEEKKEAVFNNFTTKTRYNIKVAKDRGLSVEVYDKNNLTEEILDKFQELMIITGKRDDFMIRPKQYFRNMIEQIEPYCRLYMVKYSYEKDFSRVSEKLREQMKNRERHQKKKEELEAQLSQEKDESKLEKLQKKLCSADTNIQEAERQIESFNERIKEIEEFKTEGDIYVSGAVYIYYGGKGWYFYGASHNLLRDTMPNFLMQWSMIEDSIDLGCYMYDFRGVSGDLNPDNPLYGLYKFKKGFNGKFVEFIGEFELVVDSLTYKLFKTALPKFKAIRRKLIKRK